MERTLSLLNSAIECNNIGVALLQTGRLMEAAETLRSASQLMNWVSQTLLSDYQRHRFPLTATTPQIIDSSSASIGRSVLKKAKERLVLIPNSQPIHMSQEAENDDWFLCAQPILLGLQTRLPHSCTYEASVALFNMAVAYHHCHTKPFLLKAANLFNMTHLLARTAPEDTRSSTLAMAALNNTGWIYHSLGDYVQSKRYLILLSNYIEGLPETQDETMKEERHYFLLNTVLLKEPRLASAA